MKMIIAMTVHHVPFRKQVHHLNRDNARLMEHEIYGSSKGWFHMVTPLYNRAQA